MISKSITFLVSLVAVALLSSPVAAFAPPLTHQSKPCSASSAAGSLTTQLHLFGGLKDAFKNDESLGPAQNAGLKNGPNINDNVTVNGKPVNGAVVGQKLTVVAGRARVKIPVNCQKGDCGTCMVKVNGRKVKACQTALGSGKTSIETL
jgi:ferredoxin